MPPKAVRKSSEEAPPAKATGGEAPNAWGTRPAASAPRTAATPTSPSTGPKAKAAAQTSMSIAAQAARNLGGFVPNKIFVGGVPITVTEEQFRQCFSTYGSITKVELHALRGFGYITYDSVEAVDACLEKYEEHYLCKKWVEVKRSIPRELIEAYEREQRRLHQESTASSSPTKPKEMAAPKTSAPTGAPAGGKGGPAVHRPPGAGPPQAAPAKAPGRPSVGSIQRTTTSSSIASSQGGATPAIAQLKALQIHRLSRLCTVQPK